MKSIDDKISKTFKILLEKKLHVRDLILFGSRARGDAEELSDMDIIVVIDEEPDDEIQDFISPN